MEVIKKPPKKIFASGGRRAYGAPGLRPGPRHLENMKPGLRPVPGSWDTWDPAFGRVPNMEPGLRPVPGTWDT